jgi:penicillin-binding protein 1A
MEMYDMTEEEAYDEIYTGGYSVYSVQDYEIQTIVDDIINDPVYYPATTSVALNYKLTLLGTDGITTYNYDTNTLLTYYRKQTENSKYNNIYPSEEDAKAAAETYKEAMINETGGTYLNEELKTAIQPQASFCIMDQKTGYVKAIGGGRGEKTQNLGFD